MNSSVCKGILAVALVATVGGADWLQFRGPMNNPVSRDGGLPIDLANGKNLAWKSALPGPGPSSPIVVGNRVFVTAATGSRQQRLHLVCMGTDKGDVLWHREFWATGSTVHHPFGGVAAPTPASDGQRVFAFYSSNDLACFDLEGNLQWMRGLGYENPTTRNDVGMASAPLVIGETVIVQCENQGDSFAAGIDTATGRTRWRIEREHDATWTSPAVLPGKKPGEELVLLQCRNDLAAYDPLTGKLVWKYPISCNTVASAVGFDGVAYLPAHGLNALRQNAASGEVQLLWSEPRLSSGSSSPVIADGRAYTVKNRTILVCGNLADGQVVWQLRLKGPIWATPVLAGGHAYLVNHDGLVQVVELGEKSSVVSTTQIDQGILATPAVSNGALYIRSNESLWKFAVGK